MERPDSIAQTGPMGPVSPPSFPPAKISICHATRRPKEALANRSAWLKAAAHPERVEYIFGVDRGDNVGFATLEKAQFDEDISMGPGQDRLPGFQIVVSPQMTGCVAAFNAAAEASTGAIIIGGSDDTFPIANWDAIISERLRAASGFVVQPSGCDAMPVEERASDLGKPSTTNLPPSVLLVSDGHRSDRLATMPVITRAWYEQFQFLLPPQFISVGADIWLTERASRDGCLVLATDLIFEHRHPFYGETPMDEVYKAQNDLARYAQAKIVLAELLPALPISLCMIVGGGEKSETLIRCLESARDAFDQFCLVVTNSADHASQFVNSASAWCHAHGKDFRFEFYENAPAEVPLPHLDNFAAARNLAFSLATGHWLLWLDADDQLGPDWADTSTAYKIRESATNTRFACQHWRYLMPTGGEYYRERLIARSASPKWENAVHEICRHTGDACEIKQIVILHAPLPGKDLTSPRRNLAILQSCPPFGRRQFYLCEELTRLALRESLSEAERLEHKARAIVAGRDFLASSEAGTHPAECYEICLNLADLCPSEGVGHLHDAIRRDPCRREAFAHICQMMMHRGELGRAIQYSKFLDSIPEPKPRPWTHRAIWYGWGSRWLRVKILLATDRPDDAAKQHQEYLEKIPGYREGVAHFDPELFPA